MIITTPGSKEEQQKGTHTTVTELKGEDFINQKLIPKIGTVSVSISFIGA